MWPSFKTRGFLWRLNTEANGAMANIDPPSGQERLRKTLAELQFEDVAPAAAPVRRKYFPVEDMAWPQFQSAAGEKLTCFSCGVVIKNGVKGHENT